MAETITVKSPMPSEPTEKPTEPAANERPEHIPEKFWNPETGEVRVEEMAKSYLELEKARSGEPAAEPKEGGDPKEQGDLGIPEAPAGAKALSPESMAKYAEAWQANDGKLDDASYAELEASGYPRDLVDTYIDGQLARAERDKAALLSGVGGNDGYAKMMEWASRSMSPAEKTAYNAAVTSGDMEQAKLAIAGLHAKFQQTQSNPPARQVDASGAPAAGGGDVYSSYQEFLDDVAKPEYKKSEAFRTAVTKKLHRSKI